jgi:deoxyribodipyrimidine photo-lyase
MTSIMWVHEDMLDPHAIQGLPAVFVFDEEYLSSRAYSLKRIGFIYECLLEMDVEIRRGETAAEVLDFARAHQASGIVTRLSPNPWIQTKIAVLGATAIEQEAFVDLRSKPDLRRFSRYWAKAGPHLLNPR